MLFSKLTLAQELSTYMYINSTMLWHLAMKPDIATSLQATYVQCHNTLLADFMDKSQSSLSSLSLWILLR